MENKSAPTPAAPTPIRILAMSGPLAVVIDPTRTTQGWIATLRACGFEIFGERDDGTLAWLPPGIVWSTIREMLTRSR